MLFKNEKFSYFIMLIAKGQKE